MGRHDCLVDLLLASVMDGKNVEWSCVAWFVKRCRAFQQTSYRRSDQLWNDRDCRLELKSICLQNTTVKSTKHDQAVELPGGLGPENCDGEVRVSDLSLPVGLDNPASVRDGDHDNCASPDPLRVMLHTYMPSVPIEDYRTNAAELRARSLEIAVAHGT
jgi:hypothetical protein